MAMGPDGTIWELPSIRFTMKRTFHIENDQKNPGKKRNVYRIYNFTVLFLQFSQITLYMPVIDVRIEQSVHILFEHAVYYA
jgi:hypothetical protein